MMITPIIIILIITRIFIMITQTMVMNIIPSFN